MQDTALMTAPRRRFYMPALLVVAGLTHAQALFHPFFLDDYVYLSQAHGLDWDKLVGIVTSPALDQSASSVWWAPPGTLPFYRPIGQLTFVADYFIWGLSPFGFHLTNVALHVLCTFLTWRLALRLFGHAGYAFAAAAVFALHPIHSEAVAWISGRFDTLVCVCALLSVLSYLRWADESRRGWGFAALSVFWFLVGLGCKETAMILPLMIVAIELLRPPVRRARLRRLGGLMVPFAVVAAGYMMGRTALLGEPLGKLPPPYGLDQSSPAAALQELAWNSALYLLDGVLSVPIEPAFLPLFWREHWLLFAGVVGASALLLILAAAVGRSLVSRVGLAWLVLFTAPTLLSMPGERNVYLASVGLALFIGAAYRGLMERATVSGPADRARSSQPWPARVAYAVLAIWVVVGLAQEALMGRVAMAGEKQYRQLEELVPDPPPDTRFYVVHQNPINSVGFDQALRLRYGRPDLAGCALTLSPTLIVTSADRIEPTGPASIRIERTSGTIFSSFAERFHLFAQPAAALAGLGDRFGLSLLHPPSTYEGLTALEFGFPYDLSDPRLVLLYWDNHRIRETKDLRQIGNLSELWLWPPNKADAPDAK